MQIAQQEGRPASVDADTVDVDALAAHPSEQPLAERIASHDADVGDAVAEPAEADSDVEF